MMNPLLALVLILASWIALAVWIVVYFLLVERLLKMIVGSVFGVTIGGFKADFARGRYTGTPATLRGWHITSPTGSLASGCLSDTVVWIIGGLIRAIFIAGAIVGVVVFDIFLVFAGFTQPT